MIKRINDIILLKAFLRAVLYWAGIVGVGVSPLFGQSPTPAVQLECELRGPDTIRFIENGYVPDRFYLDVVLRNSGTDGLANATLYLLGSGRFTLLSPQSRFVDSIPAGATVEILGADAFHLQASPGDRSGFDTLYLLVDGEGIRATCFLPVYVEKETRPRLELYCESPEALTFDELLNDYLPNPFPVKTIVRNVGDGAANNCSISYSGPSRVAPFDGESRINAGRLEAGEEFAFTWQMRPLRRDNGGLEALPFRAQAEGGYGNRLVAVDCSTNIFIPAARAADYICTLDVDEVRYDSVNNRYSPDPFMLRARVSNIGQGIALGMTMLTIVDDGLLLAPGQSVFDTLAQTLGPGESSGVFSKSVRPLLRRIGDSLRVTVLFSDNFGNTTRCEKLVWIPPAEEPNVLLQCSSEIDSLIVDPAQGGYTKSQFSFHAGILNLGSDPVFNVSLYAQVDPEGTLVIDKKTQEKPITSALLDTDGMRNAAWTVQALSAASDRVVRLRVYAIARSADGYYLPLISCEVPIFIPQVGKARLECGLSTDVTNGSDDMVIIFDTAKANYEGMPSSFGDYTVFRLTAEVTNTGDVVASPVTAALLLPPDLRLEEGEALTKTVSPSRLAVGEQGMVSWLLRPMAAAVQTSLAIEVLVSTAQASPAKCNLLLTLAEALAVVDISIPQDLTGISGGVLSVPINIGATPNIDPAAYQVIVRFDPAVLRFVEARSDASLTAYSWRNLNIRLCAETAQSGLNLLAVADSTESEPRERNDGGPLLHLYFEVTHAGARMNAPGYVIQTPFQFVRYPSITADGQAIAPFIHAYGGVGRLTPLFRNGEATLSGDCVLPLSASTRLLPNQPNPFNPVTHILYYLAEYTSFRIELLDVFGRFLRLIEEGSKAEGSHSVQFDAGDLPSGLYFCRLHTARTTDIRRILLTK